jgi:hypothetical protein
VASLREEHKLQIFESKEVMKICGPKKKEGNGQFMLLHYEEAFLRRGSKAVGPMS